jgi:uncharacterized protein YcbX
MADDYKRTVDQRYAKRKTDQVGFADGYPVLIASEESLDDLNNRLEQPLPMNRFRPNLVLKGASAFAEDSWKTIRVGDITFDIVKPCARCVITTIDQKSGEKGSEPLKTMASFRLVRNKAMFGMNAVHHTKGVIRIGDRAEILQP